jgi:type VI secretion system protein ImpE
MFLFQLLAVCGEWDKAGAQLRALASLSPEAQMLAAAYNPLIAAEKLRAAAFKGEGPVSVLVASSDWVDVLSQSFAAQSAGRLEDAQALRDAAFEAAPAVPGACNGQRFGWIADADSHFGPCLEMIVGGRWGLVPFEAISELSTEGAQDLRDLVWLPVQLTLRSGQAAAAFLPVRYPGSEAGSAAVRLAKVTEWRDEGQGERGLGQKLLAFDTGDDVGLLALRHLQML